MTAHTDENEAMESLAAGANAYVKKDISTDYLLMVIHTVSKGAVWVDPLIGNKVLAKLR